MSSLPYVTAPGNITRALTAIRQAGTPQKITQDFVKTVLRIPGGSGAQMNSFLKKIGFAKADGSPSELYVKFRDPATSGAAVAEAMRRAYAPLYARQDCAHELKDRQLLGLIAEETGLATDSTVVKNVLATFKALRELADFPAGGPGFETIREALASARGRDCEDGQEVTRGVGLNLNYTINLNLPATSDSSVFDAIFKSLKENLLGDEEP